ncbi:hypothetical protein EG68_10092 [Paragonimus skrjabini miyazakii]|uniref:Major facilitator superfamily (MFS) profile domain-containing protein n=1 Tax=Paragonimus skrjabini miyazakii TaxID=59628 RepID=A0A8S9YGF9_9TREM|nr:hypothetical protein EG68_10092 [Paragonimus skrjabini miyazakii]
MVCSKSERNSAIPDQARNLTTDAIPQKPLLGPIVVDELLETEVGTLGIWQWALVLLGILSTTACTTFPVFSDSEPLKRCRMDLGTEKQVSSWNLTYINQVIGGATEVDINSGCQIYDNWQEHIKASLTSNGATNLTKTLIDCPLGYVYEYQPFQYKGGIVESFDVVCGHSWLLPLGTSVFMIGMMLGHLFGGFCGARFGLKNTLIWFSLLELFTSCLCSLSGTFWLYTLTRVLIARGAYGKLCCFNLIILDITVPYHRSSVNAAYLLGFNVTSRAFLSLFAWLLQDWWWLNLAASFHCLFAFSYFFVIPESPRWLLTHMRTLEAIRVLKLGRRVNLYFTKRRNEPSEKLENLEREEIRRASVRCAAMSQFDRSLVNSKSSTTQSSYHMVTRLFANSQMTKTTILSSSLFFLFAFIFLGNLLYVRRIRESVYLVSFVVAIVGIPGVGVALLSYRIVRQRKPPLAIAFLILALILGIGGVYTIFVESGDDIVLSVTSVIAIMALVNIQCMMFIYIPELYPPDVRALGFGTAAGIGRLGSALSTFANRLDAIYRHGVPAILYAVVAIISTLITLCLSDTTGVETIHSRKSMNQPSPKSSHLNFELSDTPPPSRF